MPIKRGGTRLSWTTKYRPAAERFWEKVEFTDSCWLWTASTNRYGYGQFRLNGRMIGPHCYAYEFCVEDVPVGLQIDHLCRVRNCVNPDHMEVVTSRTNTMRGVGPTARNARKTHCEHGHLFDEVNTGYHGTRRVCKACDRRKHRLK